MKKINVSQSLIKDLRSYHEGKQCGNIITEKYIKGNPLPSSGVMNLGAFFEYKATGALPKSGEVPEPETTKSGTLTAPYKRAEAQAENFKKLCSQMGVKITATQERAVNNGMEGTCDILAEYNGEEVVIDLKYSGLVNDEWSEFGWKGLRIFDSEHRGHQKQLEHHQIQAIHYSYLFERPFYYWVFSSSTGAEETGENYLMKMVIDENKINDHVSGAAHAQRDFNILANIGFQPYPEYNRCQNCPLFESCEDKVVVPQAIEVPVI